MANDGTDSDGLRDSHPTLWKSKISAIDEPGIKAECHIPYYMKIHFDTEKLGAVVHSDTHEVCLYEAMFKAGFRLSFIPVVQELLGFLNLAPHQIAPNSWRIFHCCLVLWPLVLSKQHQLTVKEFLHMYRVHRNPGGARVYNFQTKRGRFVQLSSKYSNNQWWKNKFFFVSGQCEFAPKEKVVGPRVPCEMNTVVDLALLKEPILTAEEQSRANDVTTWSRTHKKLMYSDWLASMSRLSEFVYDVDASSVSRPMAGTTRLLVNQSPPAANTRGTTPRKEQAQATDKGKLKKVDKGKGKMIEPEKPKKLAL